MEEKIIIQEKGAQEKTKKYLNNVLLCVLIFAGLFAITYFMRTPDFLDTILEIVIIGLAVFALYNIMCFFMSKCEIVVTSHRVYGRALKEQVDLPLDSISAVKKGWFRSIVVATSSGKVVFYLLASQEKIFSAVSNLLKDRQNKSHAPIVAQATGSNADELKKYKELLDSGVISQEEFDNKKKQLLGL